MPDLGYYTVPVILSFDGTTSRVKRQLGSQFQALGRDGGKQMGKAAGDALNRDKSIEKAAQAKSKAIDKLADAMGRARTAEAALAKARSSGDTARIVAAEERFASARRKATAETQALASATKQLDSAMKTAQSNAERVAQAAAADGDGGGMMGLMLLGSRGASGLTSMAGRAGGAMGLAAKAGIAGVLTAGAGAAVIAPFVAGFKLFDWAAEVGLPLERVLNEFRGVTGATREESAAMGAQARALGSDISLAGTTASDAAKAMTELAKAGFTVQQSIDASRATVQLATAAQIDAAQAAEIVGTAINTFGLKATDAQMVVDDFAATVLGSAADVPDLSLALSQAGAVASGFGISLQDTLATLGTFAQMGIKSSDAGTLMKTSLLAWTSATEPQAQAMDRLNLTLSDSEGNFVGYRSMLEQLSTASKNMTQMEFNAATATLFGTDAVRAGMLARGEAIPTFDRLSAEIDKEGQASRMAGAQMEGLPGIVEGVSNAMDGLKLSVYDAGSAIATALGKEGLSVFDQLSSWVKEHQPEMIGFFTTLGTAAVSGMASVMGAIEEGSRALAQFVNVIGDTLGGIQRAFAASQRLLGRDEDADKADALADSMFGWGDSLYGVADSAGAAEDKLVTFQGELQTAGDTANTTAQETRDHKVEVDAFGNAIHTATEKTDAQTTAVNALGDAIKGLPPKQDSILNITDGTGQPIPFEQILTGGVTLPGMGGVPGSNPLGALSPSGSGSVSGSVTPPGAPGGGGVPGQNPLDALTPGGGGRGAGLNLQLAGPKAAVHQAMLGQGFPESEWPALQQLIQGESSWNPSARNPSSGAFGLFQFLGHENDKYGALGGYSMNPASQARAGLQYIKDRYGSPSAALAFWNAQSPHWYDAGGGVPGQGSRDTVPAWLTPGEFVVKKKAAAQFLPLLEGINGFENGGIVPEVQQVQQIASQFGLTLSSGRRNEPGSFHNSGMAGDFSNGVRTDAMLAFATYMAQNFGSSLAELIYDDPRFSMEIDEGKIVSRAFFAAAGDHTDHVHVAVRSGTPALLGSGSLGGNAGMGMPTITTGSTGATSAFGTSSGGQPGTFTVDQAAVADANARVAEADARVREAEAEQRELEADAKESEKIRAQADVDKAKADADKARRELEEAKKGDFTPTPEGTRGGSTGGKERGGSPVLGELGSIASSFFKDTFGFGSMFPDLANLMPVQMAGTLIDSAMSIASGIGSGEWQLNPNGLPLLQQTSTSNAPFGIPDVAAPAAPPGIGGAAGAAPGPTQQVTIDASQNFNNSPLGISPDEMDRKQRERFSRALPRIPVR